MRIFITGFMGAGKSFLGKALAEQLGLSFIDLDELIETEASQSISGIFQNAGEVHFREIEAACLRSLAMDRHIVVATGGGCPCFHGNMDWMNKNGITVYFCASAELLAQRLASERTERPLIAKIPAEGLEAFIESKLAERASFYEQSHLKFLVPAQGTEGLEDLERYLKRFFT